MHLALFEDIFIWHMWFLESDAILGDNLFFMIKWLTVPLLSLLSQPISCQILLALLLWCHSQTFIPIIVILFELLTNLYFSVTSASNQTWGQFNLARVGLLAIIFIFHHCQLNWIWNPQLNMWEPPHYGFTFSNIFVTAVLNMQN